MRIKRKILVSLLISLISIFLLLACGGSDSDDSSDANSSSSWSPVNGSSANGESNGDSNISIDRNNPHIGTWTVSWYDENLDCNYSGELTLTNTPFEIISGYALPGEKNYSLQILSSSCDPSDIGTYGGSYSVTNNTLSMTEYTNPEQPVSTGVATLEIFGPHAITGSGTISFSSDDNRMTFDNDYKIFYFQRK